MRPEIIALGYTRKTCFFSTNVKTIVNSHQLTHLNINVFVDRA